MRQCLEHRAKRLTSISSRKVRDSSSAVLDGIFARMIIGTGFDLVAIERFLRFLNRTGQRGMARLFTEAERQYCSAHDDPTPFFAARFAAKEAFYKALGTGVGRAGGWQDVEVVRLASGKPLLMLHGKAAQAAHEVQVRTLHLSMSHTSETAGAIVILEA